MIEVFLIGLGMGFFASVFPGPINLETVRRALSKGTNVGAAFGLGAVLADVLFATASAFGAAALFNSLPNFGKGLLGLVSSIIVCWMGVSALRAKVKPPSPAALAVTDNTPDPRGFKRLVKHFAIGFGMTITSVSTFIFWLVAGVWAAKFVGDADDFALAPFVKAAGVAVSCSMWVLGAATIAGRFHRSLEPKTYLQIERVVGVTLIVISVFSLYEACGYFLGHKSKVPDAPVTRTRRRGRGPRDGHTTRTLAPEAFLRQAPAGEGPGLGLRVLVKTRAARA